MPRPEELRRDEGRAAGLALGLGIRLSAAVLAAGLALDALRPGGGGEHVALAGIAILIATPFLRVAMLCGAFARGRQWRMLAVSASVLALLLAGVWLGRGRG